MCIDRWLPKVFDEALLEAERAPVTAKRRVHLVAVLYIRVVVKKPDRDFRWAVDALKCRYHARVARLPEWVPGLLRESG